MSAILRGIKNTFRNSLRTAGFATIIAISMTLAFSMLLANQAVNERGNQLKKQIGSTLRVTPVGAADFSTPGVPFTDKDVIALKGLAHVKEIMRHTALSARNPKETKQQTGAEIESFGQGSEPVETNLLSALEWPKIPGAKDRSATLPIIPIAVEGTDGDRIMSGKRIVIVKGQSLDQSKEVEAIVGEALAEKNKLTIGSSFTVGGKTFIARGIAKGEDSQGGNMVIIPFAMAAALLQKKDEIAQLTVTADSIETVDSVGTAIKKALGEKRADVVSLQPEAAQIVMSLKSIDRISFITLVISLGAAAMTLLLTMLLVVRERKKEIGVLKAIGATNIKIIVQFLAEALMLTFIGTIIGIALAAATSNSILQGLLSSEFRSPAPDQGSSVIQLGGTAQPTVEALTAGIGTLIDIQFILYGLGIALVIAIVATVIPAFLIAKVRPAQIMRSN